MSTMRKKRKNGKVITIGIMMLMKPRMSRMKAQHIWSSSMKKYM